MRRSLAAIALVIAPLGATAPLPAQAALDAAARSRVIDALVRRLEADYLFLDRARAMAADVRARAARGAYDSAAAPAAFAAALTRDLQALSHDKHLRVLAGDGPTPGQRLSPDALRERSRADGFGIGAPRRLGGDVAYLEIRGFGLPPEVIADALAAAMDSVADAAALIVDVRRNGGGSPFSVALVSSYLFGRDTVHLNSLYWRALDRTDDFYTRATVAGRRFGPTKPVYVLTSRRTFSAAEEFTYNLQALGRATIVGDTTGGGAHPGGVERLGDGLTVFVPKGRAINPITRTNWEGTGVRPDIPVPADSALAAAHRAALRTLLARERDAARKSALERALAAPGR